MTRDTGSISAFAVVVMAAAIVAAGLVHDGARILAGRRVAGDVAGNAARAGAQALDEASLRRGTGRIDAVDAHDAVARYVATTSATGIATVTDDTVTVDATLQVPTGLLGAVGVDDAIVSARRSARAAVGVRTADD